MTWCDKFRPVIAATIAQSQRDNLAEKEIRAALRTTWGSLPLESYERKGYPYQIWRDEIAKQLGKRKPADRPRRRIASRTLRKFSAAEAREWLRKRQMGLFDTGGQQ